MFRRIFCVRFNKIVESVVASVGEERKRPVLLRSGYREIESVYFIFKQKKRGKGGDGRNKENIIEAEVQSDKEEDGQAEEPVRNTTEKKLCYEVKTSDVMGR